MHGLSTQQPCRLLEEMINRLNKLFIDPYSDSSNLPNGHILENWMKKATMEMPDCIFCLM